MQVTLDMELYQALVEKANKVDHLEKEVSYWQGEYEDANKQRLNAMDRVCALQMFLVDELEYTFGETWDISEKVIQKRKDRKIKREEKAAQKATVGKE